MEAISLSRKNLYEEVWTKPLSNLCMYYDISEEGLGAICRRLNVPIPEKSHWRKLSQGKKTHLEPFPEKSHGTKIVILYKRNDALQKQEHAEKIRNLLGPLDTSGEGIGIDEKVFDKLIITTKEGMPKHGEVRHDYWEKNRLVAVHVSPERFCRALWIMDLLIKLLRFKKYDLIVEQRNTFAVIDGEKIQISLGEKNRRVEFLNENKRSEKENHPTGVLFLRKEGSHSNRREWKDGKVLLEDQLLKIVDELVAIAGEQKGDRARWKKAQEEREEEARVKRELEMKQRTELAHFRQLLFDAHRFSVSAMLRTYIDRIEENALSNDSLTDEIKEWVSWARKKADWFDPSVPGMPDGLLNGIDIENLRTNSYTGYNYGNSGYEQTKDSFWKPWWSR